MTGVGIEGKKPFLHPILASQPNPQGVDETLKLTPVALVGQSTNSIKPLTNYLLLYSVMYVMINWRLESTPL